MKTKEEILNAELETVNMDSAIEITCASLRAMQLYSDQRKWWGKRLQPTKIQIKVGGRLFGKAINCFSTAKSSALKTNTMKANEFIIAPENAGKSIVEIMQLYSDQKNKEKDSEIQRLTKEVEELKEKMTAEHCPSLPECYKASQELTRLRELLKKAKGMLLRFWLILTRILKVDLMKDWRMTSTTN